MFLRDIKKGVSLDRIEIYLKAGANPKFKDSKGRTLIELYGTENEDIKTSQKDF